MSSAANSWSRAMRILLVDDNPMFCYATALDLEQAGHTVLTANDGASALDRFIEQMPDVLITDVDMPILDGGELVRRALAIAPELPVVVVTASHDRAQEILQEHSGAALRHVAKPLLSRPLLKTVEAVVFQARARGNTELLSARSSCRC